MARRGASHGALPGEQERHITSRTRACGHKRPRPKEGFALSLCSPLVGGGRGRAAPLRHVMVRKESAGVGGGPQKACLNASDHMVWVGLGMQHAATCQTLARLTWVTIVFSGGAAAAWGVSEPLFPGRGSAPPSGSQASALSSRTAWERTAAMQSSTWKCRKLFQVYLKNRSWGRGAETVLNGLSPNSGTTGVSTPPHRRGGWAGAGHQSAACRSVCCLRVRD